MSVTFLATSGGPHPPEKWADITASHILSLIEIGPTASRQAEVAKRDLGVKLLKVLVGLHANNQAVERAALKKTGAQYLSTPLDPHLSAKVGTTEIVKATMGSPFADHFQKPEVQTFITNTLGQHFADVMHIERRWYVDRNPNSDHARAYKAKYG